MNFICVALGGALGAIGRYSISLIPIKSELPFLTLITNILGAMLIGFIVGIADSKSNISQNTSLFWKAGVCGGFTTFSTFSLEAFNLLEKGKYSLCLTYIMLSVIGCVFGVYLGKRLSSLV